MDLTKIKDVEIDGIDYEDYPNFVDAYIVSATCDGIQLVEDELNTLNENSDFKYDQVMKKLF